ncbi:hypothetical protein RFI_10039 [Reticulomyxa filosa]|uniref:Uncharacterized protein n=1 Tax=Reticulomyxa filosa TaxID=46433 RepID=X6NMD6_RETFI|nr:hypothetical protein RFI_10039 [Reticulomyxa filosa]|eukprot:ETO27093.1 hypothetical protein RFI_10039 [Reticulomyxa filosa]
MKLYKDKEVKKTSSVAVARYRYGFIFYCCGQFSKTADIVQAFIDPQTPLHEQCALNLELSKFIQSLIQYTTKQIIGQQKLELPPLLKPFADQFFQNEQLLDLSAPRSLPSPNKKRKANKHKLVSNAEIPTSVPMMPVNSNQIDSNFNLVPQPGCNETTVIENACSEQWLISGFDPMLSLAHDNKSRLFSNSKKAKKKKLLCVIFLVILSEILIIYVGLCELYLVGLSFFLCFDYLFVILFTLLVGGKWKGYGCSLNFLIFFRLLYAFFFDLPL